MFLFIYIYIYICQYTEKLLHHIFYCSKTEKFTKLLSYISIANYLKTYTIYDTMCHIYICLFRQISEGKLIFLQVCCFSDSPGSHCFLFVFLSLHLPNVNKSLSSISSKFFPGIVTFVPNCMILLYEKCEACTRSLLAVLKAVLKH